MPDVDADVCLRSVDYPADALKLGIEGDLTLRVELDETGHVHGARVVSGLGHGLDDAAIFALTHKCKFTPAIAKDGTPVAYVIPRFVVHFEIPTASSRSEPPPSTPDALYAAADKAVGAQQWADARRLYDAFVEKYPSDRRAARAHYEIGDAYAAEKRFAEAIGEYTKAIENFPGSDAAPDAMYKSGLAFYALKHCSDAKVYFQELLKRYPLTSWKKDAEQRLRDLARVQSDKAICHD
jgi:tol-pal system protein YbgF